MDKITGLMTGADDYMTKPFSPAELTARIDALYRRIDSDGSSNQIELKHGPFVLNTRNRTLDKDSRRIKLTQVEYAIVKLFMQNPGRALSPHVQPERTVGSSQNSGGDYRWVDHPKQPRNFVYNYLFHFIAICRETDVMCLEQVIS